MIAVYGHNFNKSAIRNLKSAIEFAPPIRLWEAVSVGDSLKPPMKGMTSMQIHEAITAFSQSEKIKAGLIWASQIVEIYKALPEEDKPGAEKIIKAIVGMIGNEILICKKSAPNELWMDIEKNIETAAVMIHSKVVFEAGFHLTRALSQVTTIGQRSMSILRDRGLL